MKLYRLIFIRSSSGRFYPIFIRKRIIDLKICPIFIWNQITHLSRFSGVLLGGLPLPICTWIRSHSFTKLRTIKWVGGPYLQPLLLSFKIWAKLVRNRPREYISTEPPPLPSYEDLLTQVLEAWKIPREEWVELKVEQIWRWGRRSGSSLSRNQRFVPYCKLLVYAAADPGWPNQGEQVVRRKERYHTSRHCLLICTSLTAWGLLQSCARQTHALPRPQNSLPFPSFIELLLIYRAPLSATDCRLWNCWSEGRPFDSE